MIICNDCKKEMRCEHTGTRVRFGSCGDHVYAGDTFECPECHKKTTVCNSAPYNESVVILSVHDVIMDKIVDTSKIKKKTINLRRTEDERATTNGGRSIPSTPNTFAGDGEQWKGMQEIIQKITENGWYVGNYTDDRPTSR